MYLSYWRNRDAQILIGSRKSKNSRLTNLRFCVLENDTLQAYRLVFAAWVTEWRGGIVDVSFSFLNHAWQFADLVSNVIIAVSVVFFAPVLVQKFFKLFWKVFIQRQTFAKMKGARSKKNKPKVLLLVYFISVAIQSWSMVTWNSYAWTSSRILDKSSLLKAFKFYTQTLAYLRRRPLCRGLPLRP